MEQSQKNTLSALGGMPVRDAMGGLATGNREGKPARREQTIYTPIVLRDMLLALGDGVIALDPCSGPDSIIGALESWEGTRYQKLDAKGRPKFRKDGSPALGWRGRGLEENWAISNGLVYANPPYEDLQEWLLHARCSAEHNAEIVLLGPVRTHRRWWRKAWSSAQERAWLDPLTFGGFDQSFPAPLALWYWGQRAEKFRAVFRASGLGEIA